MASVSSKLRAEFCKNPDANVKKLARKYEVSDALVYLARKEVNSTSLGHGKKAKSNSGLSKRQLIENYLRDNPEARTKDVSEMFEAASPYVSQVRSAMGLSRSSGKHTDADSDVVEIEELMGDVKFDIDGAIIEFVKRYGPSKVANAAVSQMVAQHKIADLKSLSMKILDDVSKNQIRIVS